MSFKPYTEKIKKKKIEIWSDPDPQQNDKDPKHCLKLILNSFDLKKAIKSMHVKKRQMSIMFTRSKRS